MSNFPNAIDTDLEIGRVDDNVTEVGADTINSLRDAVFAIETALGISLQGNLADFATRISVSIDANGNLRSSALESAGLVALPINNSHVGDTAGILESKLDLDFSTRSLRNSISSLEANIDAISSSLTSSSSRLNGHILGTSNFHDGYQIRVERNNLTTIGGFSSTNVGDILNEISTLFLAGDANTTPHIDLNLPSSVKHLASSLSVSSSTTYSVLDMDIYDMQSVVENIDSNLQGQQEIHIDGFHSNGIFKNINAGDYYNPNQQRFSVSGVSFTSGTSVITIPGISTGGVASFADRQIFSGSLIEIGSVIDDGVYQILEVGPLAAAETLGDIPTLAANQLYINHIFVGTAVVGDNVSVSIYDAASVSSETAPLACAVKSNETLVDSIAILNPNAARVVSLGFNGDILSVDGYEINIEVGLDDSKVRGLTITNLNRDRLGAHIAANAQTVAERINAFVSDPTLGHHFPITATPIGNEIGIAHNLVGSQYTLRVRDGYTGNYPLGLDSFGANVCDRTIYGNSNNTYSVNGRSPDTLRTIFSGTSTLSATATAIPLFDSDGKLVDPTLLGIQAGDVLHITRHSTLDINGSYTIASTSSTAVSVFAAEAITTDTDFDVLVTSSFVSLDDLLAAGETNKGLVSVYVDEDGYTFYKQRAQYATLGNNVEIVDVSSGFPIDDVIVAITASGDYRLFNIIYSSVSGATVTVYRDFTGTFRLYHTNNIDYVTVKTTGLISVASETLSIYRTLNDDEAMELCLVHFDGSTGITNLVDKRLFGNLSGDQIRDDFVEIYSQRPTFELRSNGVVRGFELMESIEYTDGYLGMHALPLTGGVAYVDGVRCEVETQRALIQSYDDSFLALDGYRVIGINEHGTIKSYFDQLGEILFDGYNSDPYFGKILPLYRVTMVDGLIYSVTDVRLFINNLDEKIDIIVDATNNHVGNFKTLEGALLYAENYPSDEKLTIRLLSSVTATEPLRVPSGVSIIGYSAYGGDKYKIINDRTLNDHFVILDGYNHLENIEIASTNISMNGALILVDGSNVSIEKCLLQFTDLDSIAASNQDVGIEVSGNASDNVDIINNRITKVYAGIISAHGCANIRLTDNEISHISGTATETYGIMIGSAVRSIENAIIERNKITIPDLGASDVRGINIDVGQTIVSLRVANNDIIHVAGTTVTNGIRVENIASSGNFVEELFISDNNIYGVMSNDNDIWGIWVSNTEVADVSNNIVRQVSRGGNTNNGFIGVGANVNYVKINANILQDSDGANYGIYKITTNATTEKAMIINNTISNLGGAAYYIYGTTAYSTIGGNILDGEGDRGIHWAGAYSRICGNNMNDASGAFSFTSYGIFTTASDLDICDNTINSLSSGSVGIVTNTGRNRIKIIGNTVAGTSMTTLISVHGNHHIVSKNKLQNTTDNTTSFILLTTVADSLVDGNIMNAIGTGATNGVLESGTTSRVTFSNNVMIGTITNGFNLTNADDCFVFGNRVPDSIGYTVGPTPATATINTNVMEANRGVPDTVGVSMAAGVTSGDSEWRISATDDSWSPAAAAAAYYLYFPLGKIPNGARFISVDVSGTNPDAGGTLVLDVFRKSMKSAFAIDAISTAAVTINEAVGVFGPGQGTTCNIAMDTTNDVNIANYEESNYYLRIATDGATAVATKIHGVTINFRY
jgi:hypothetical protein